MIKRIRNFYFLSVFVLILSACAKEDNMNEQRAREQEMLKKYLEDNNIDTPPTQSGLYYIEIEQGNGVQAGTDDYAIINYMANFISGDVFSTNDKQVAKENDIYNEYVLYGSQKLSISENIPGLTEGLSMMQEGDSVQLIIPSYLAFGNKSVGNIPSYTTLVYFIRLAEIIADPAEHENYLMQQYLDSIIKLERFDSSGYHLTTSGLHYIEQEKGEGQKPKSGNELSIQYHASLLDGRIIETTAGKEPFSFVYKTYELIQGLEEGIGLMQPGGETRFIIPFYLAHGADGRHQPGMKEVPPYSSLIVDVELLKVE